jgi:hypothetical protein
MTTAFAFSVNFSRAKRVAPAARAARAVSLLAVSAVAATALYAAEPTLPYTVKASDKLITFSNEVLVSPQAWGEVARLNGLANPNLIFPGQKLNIPLRLIKSQAAASRVISVEGSVTRGGQPLQVGAPVPEGSQLATGANSSAIIELGDGSRVKLLPGSLAEVVTNKTYAMRNAAQSGSTNWFSGVMRLAEGSLETVASTLTQRAEPLQIRTPTSSVGVRGTVFRVGFDGASKDSRTEVLEGKVRADNPAQGSGADLPLGTGAVIKPAEREVKVVNLLAAPDLSGVSADVLKPQAAWPMPSLSGASAYRVQVASDDKFNAIVRDLKVTNASADLSSLPNGNWFARVRGIDGQGLEGFDSVKLIAVKDGQWRVSYSSLRFDGGQTLVAWTGVQPNGQALAAERYSAVVARDAALSQGVVNVQMASDARGSELNLGNLSPGVYFIKLRSTTGGAFTDSAVYRFELPGNWGATVLHVMAALEPAR